MGPSIIFDKSALQSLKDDEAMWLDNFYQANITPLFFVETLADLEKEVRAGKTPEEGGGIIAYKTPENSCSNVHHMDLLYVELMGYETVEMSGRPIVCDGKFVKLGDETGIIYLESKETEAFRRWQRHEFLEIERVIAKKWRAELQGTAPDIIKQKFEPFLHALGIPKSFEELKKMVDNMLNQGKTQGDILLLGLKTIGVSPEAVGLVVKRWEDSGKPQLKEFMPFFMHVFSVNLFFYLGTASNLFSRFPHAQTHFVDIAYLYYLPFCDIFVSSDKLHITIAPLFFRPDQTFINGNSLKTDLENLDLHFSALPDEVKDRGTFTFAQIPPDDSTFFTTRMWDKYMSSKWRGMQSRKFDGSDQIDSETDRKLVEKIERFTKNAVPAALSADEDDIQQMIVKRMISARKGKWKRFPPEVESSKKRIME